LAIDIDIDIDIGCLRIEVGRRAAEVGNVAEAGDAGKVLTRRGFIWYDTGTGC